MTLDAVLIAFAFSAGAVAFLNPCGFAMLPTYISYFVENDSRQMPGSTKTISGGRSELISVRRLAKGALIGLLVTAAFIGIFGVTGLIISSVGIGIAKFLPWIAVFSGVLIVGIGVAKLLGRTFYITITLPASLHYGNSQTNRKSHFMNFFLFGIGYSIASLSCTLPIFLFIVFQALSTGGMMNGFTVFLSYALGMGAVMVAVSMAINLTNQTFVKWLRKLMPKMNIITSVLLILAGSYLIYYNLVVGRLLVS